MELLLIIVFLLWTAGDPRWLGQHLAKTRIWYDYYLREGDATVRRAVAKERLKRIRKKYPNAFR